MLKRKHKDIVLFVYVCDFKFKLNALKCGDCEQEIMPENRKQLSKYYLPERFINQSFFNVIDNNCQ